MKSFYKRPSGTLFFLFFFFFLFCFFVFLRKFLTCQNCQEHITLSLTESVNGTNIIMFWPIF